jgi:hypothetical protein
MVRFISASFARVPSFSAANILGAWEFVAAVIDHVVAGESGRNVRSQLLDLYLDEDRREDQERLQHVRRDHDPQRDQAKRGLACKA